MDLEVQTKTSTIKLIITELGNPIGKKFIKASKKVRDKFPNINIIYKTSPKFRYIVPSPLVELISNSINTRGYGNDGLELIKDIYSGKLNEFLVLS